MAVSIPQRFPLQFGRMVKDIALPPAVESIRATPGLVLLQTGTWAYAKGNRRAIFERSWRSGLKEVLTTYQTVCRGRATFGESRESVDIEVDGEDIDFEIRIYDLTGANEALNTVIGGPLSATISGRNVQTGTITVTGGTGQEVVVDVQYKVLSPAGSGRLYSVRLLEQAVTVANLPG